MVFLAGATSNAEILRCEVRNYGPFGDIRVDIVVPDAFDLSLSARSKDGTTHDFVAMDVGVGLVEIGAPKFIKPMRHKFIVTRQGSEANSLLGFFIDETYITVIRVDTWEKGKPIYLYDPYLPDKVVTGLCQ
jgi:hypothetical protein